MMDNDVLKKLLKGDMPSESDIREACYDMCDRVHASCNEECLVFALNGDKVPMVGNNCACFKSGADIARFIRVRIR